MIFIVASVGFVSFPKMKVGLTGGMGSGKSTVARIFEKNGFQRIDSDAIVHELLKSDNETIEAVVEAFGERVRLDGEGVNRPLLGTIVFSDSEQLKLLEEMLHPKVGKRWESIVETEPDANWIIEVPLLFEKNLQNKVDFTVCVFTDLSTQVERLEQKGIGRAQALTRINRQMPVSEKAENADFVLLNEGSLEFLEDQVKTLLTRL